MAFGADYTPPKFFEGLSAIGDTLKQNRLEANRAAAFQGAQNGVPLNEIANRLGQIGDIEGAIPFARLAEAQKQHEATLAFHNAALQETKRLHGAQIENMQLMRQHQNELLKFQKEQAEKGEWELKQDEETGGWFWSNKRNQETKPAIMNGQAVNPAIPGPQSNLLPTSGEGGTAAGGGEGENAPAFQPQTSIPGVSGKILRQERAKRIATNEEDIVRSAKSAAEFKPAVDEAAAAYRDLIKSGGIGPIVGSSGPFGLIGPRQVQALAHSENEALRQRYDTAIAKVKALVTSAQNKGEGAVSNFERMMYAAQFPELTAVDPLRQHAFLRQLQGATNQSIAAAGKTGAVGTQPAVSEVLNRPAIGGPSKLYDSKIKIRHDDAELLLKNPTPEAQDFFDDAYGIGAADAVLKRKR